MDLLLVAPVVASSGYSAVIKDKTDSPGCIVLHFYMCHPINENSVVLNSSFYSVTRTFKREHNFSFSSEKNGYDLLEKSIIMHT